jgi:hypothetical protein
MTGHVVKLDLRNDFFLHDLLGEDDHDRPRSSGAKAASSREQQRLSSCTVHGMCGKRGIAEFLRTSKNSSSGVRSSKRRNGAASTSPVDALGFSS